MKSLVLKLMCFMVFPLCFSGCGDAKELSSFSTLIQSDLPHDIALDSAAGAVSEVANDNLEFATRMYKEVIAGHEDNVIFSPYSISTALTMTYAGASADTAREMRTALNFKQADDALFQSFGILNQSLINNAGNDAVTVNSLNDIWVASNINWKQPFLNVLASNFGTGLNEVDFVANSNKVRRSVNKRIAKITENKIKDLLPEGSVSEDTVMVLTNAIYLDAKWKAQFDPTDTRPGEFKQLSGQIINVQYMRQLTKYKHARDTYFDVVELPYVGDGLSMLILIPDVGAFTKLESELSASLVSNAIENMEIKSVNLFLPKFSVEYDIDLQKHLSSLGMPSAFSESADFSAMTDDEGIYISSALHKAFIKTDEEGTEAAAATAVVGGISSVPVSDVEIFVDRPFLLVIRDVATSGVVFLGRVISPSA